MPQSKLTKDIRFLRRLTVAAGIFGGFLVILGVAMAAFVRQASGRMDELVSFYLAIFSLPGALLVAAAGPMWRARRWGYWIAQLVCGFLVTVFGSLGYLAMRKHGMKANNEATLWLLLTASMGTLVAYLIRGGWITVKIGRAKKKAGRKRG